MAGSNIRQLPNPATQNRDITFMAGSNIRQLPNPATQNRDITVVAGSNIRKLPNHATTKQRYHSRGWSTDITVVAGSNMGGGPRVVVSTAAFQARVRGWVPDFGGLQETKNVSSPSTCESQYCGEPP